jgi:hypothetical protein
MKGSFVSGAARADREGQWRQQGLWSDEPLLVTIERAVERNPGMRLIFSSAEKAEPVDDRPGARAIRKRGGRPP